MSASAPARPFSSYALTALGVVACALLGWAAWDGRSYYLLAAAERPLHEAHERLRSSGTAGLPYGVIGYFLIILNLGYLIRRSYVRWEWMGTLRDWMSMHVFTGIVGCALILLHSAFQPRSPLGSLAFYSLFIVLVTGLVGRYIYAHVPRSVQGQELELDDLRRQLEERRAALAARGIGLDAAPAGPAPGAGAAAAPGLAAALSAMMEGDRQAARDYARLRAAILADPALAAEAKEILPLARRFVLESRWLVYYQELRDVMAGWRFFHRWFAIVMLIFALGHVLIATRMGGLFSGMP
ncbi:MAG: hypothetical protein ACHQ51_12630 [Elusimicrobiota bacterium]